MSGLLANAAALFVVPASTTAPICHPAPASAVEADALAWQPPVAREWPSTWAPDMPAGGDAADVSPADSRVTEPAGAVVIGGGSDALVLGAALAGELRRRERARAALLLVWDPDGGKATPLPACPAARRLAAVLGDDADVAARGQLAELRLPVEASAAAEAAQRLTRRVDVPTVLVLCGPRSPNFDALLTERDLLVVLQPDGLPASLAGLAADELRALNRRVLVEGPIGGVGRRLAALCGLGRARRLGGRLEALVPC